MLGVKSIAPKTKGMPIKKPWQVLSTSESLTALLTKHKCDKKHQHVPCEGSDTLQTGFYHLELATTIAAFSHSSTGRNP